MAEKFVDESKIMYRVSDLTSEPKRMLPPIKGYENQPLVTLEKSIEPLILLVPDIEQMVWTVKQNCQKPEDGLSSDESGSIMLYTLEWEPPESSFYFILNSTLRTENRQKLRPWFLFFRLIIFALSKLPTIPHQIIYRGIKIDMSKEFEVGKTFIWWSFSSCTSKIDVIKHFLGKKGPRTIINIESNSAKNISRHSFYQTENEILLYPARQFQVISSLDAGNQLHIVHLQEIEPPFPLIHIPQITSTAGDSNKYIRTHSTESTTTNLYRPVDFRLPVGGGQLSDITALIRTLTGKFHTPIIDDNHDGTVSIKYQPAEIGLHKLDVFYQGQPITGSPFKFHVDQVQTGYVTAYGPGLSHGVCNESSNFRIITKEAGSGGLSVAVQGSSKAEIQCKDNKDGTCDVTYWPTAPGEYTITVKFADKHIVGSPFAAKITGLPASMDQYKRSHLTIGSQSEFSLRTTEIDIHDLQATIRSPSGLEEGCVLKTLANGSLGTSFIPREIGDHRVNVYRDGKHIKNSPFRIHVGSSEIGEANKVKVFGRGLQEGYANQTNDFAVITRDAGYGGLSLSIEGPSKADIECHDNEDGSCLVTYKPTEPGLYIVNVKFADKHVTGSPFIVNVSGHGSSRLRESITRERRAVDITHIGSQCELSLKIPGTSPFDMSAYVTSLTGHLENCEIVDLNDCNYSIKFIPKEMGVHTVSVKHKDMHIPGSPFEFTVGPIQGGGAKK